MRRSVHWVSAIFLVVVLLMASTEMGGIGVAEGRTCESQSQRFKGPCSTDRNCGSVCETEGFQGGNCRGFRRRCFCTKHCME
ncbi:hypothetical protein Vadar_022290 [Vaccinium darrowii]|uniref:Uncharacterized protein n=1 Tax=Vaccinium darrowii TaxID=229202 RepID=A0ACB7ZNA2_9ERIC|nr:hypothetical protein Vadar_022290 [Vaccinium darrowii]